MKQTTKFTLKLCKPLLDQFNTKINKCFIKRDAFLNHILKSETTYLKKDMKGLRLSNNARRYISQELGRLDTKTINIVVDKSVASGINAVIKNSNMVRDAFMNRVIWFLGMSDETLKHLELPTSLGGDLFEYIHFYVNDITSPVPLTTIERAINFNGMRMAFEAVSKTIDIDVDVDVDNYKSIYLMHLKSPFDLKKDRFINGMYCYLEDKFVPGTKEFKENQKFHESFSKELKKWGVENA